MAADTRKELLDAAERLLAKKGLASTREIAREAGCSDGALYHHFKDRLDLYLALLLERLPDFTAPIHALPYRVGERTVAENLAEVAQAALAFYYRVAPLFSALFAERPLLAAYRQALRGANKGPHRSARAAEAYLAAEQRLGRVGADADPAIIGETLFAACYRRAFAAHFTDEWPSEAEDREFARRLGQALVAGLAVPAKRPAPRRAPGKAGRGR